MSTKYHSNILTYRKTHTLAETGKKFNLSSERVRQIEFIKHRKRCSVHKRYFYNKCSYCLNIKNYTKYVNNSTFKELLKESYREAKNPKRDYLATMKKSLLIKRLYDVEMLSFTHLSILLNREYSAIKNLYRKNYVAK